MKVHLSEAAAEDYVTGRGGGVITFWESRVSEWVSVWNSKRKDISIPSNKKVATTTFLLPHTHALHSSISCLFLAVSSLFPLSNIPSFSLSLSLSLNFSDARSAPLWCKIGSFFFFVLILSRNCYLLLDLDSVSFCWFFRRFFSVKRGFPSLDRIFRGRRDRRRPWMRFSGFYLSVWFPTK